MGTGAYVSRLLRRQLQASVGGQPFWREDFNGVVLFVDIADSSALTERFAAQGPHGAERLNHVLNRYFGDVFGIIAAHGGDVAHVEGDAVLAVWHDDPPHSADRAGRAALALRDGYGRDSAVTEVVLRHRIALAAGSITAVSLLGLGERGFMVLTGGPVHEIADLAHAGEPGEVIVADSVAQRIAGTAEIERTAAGFLRLLGLPVGEVGRGPEPEPQPLAVEASVDPLTSRFLPRIVLERADAAAAGWLAEFRMLSMVYVHLRELDPAAPDAADRIHAAIGTIHGAIEPLAADLSELVVGDKGVIAVMAFGLPGQARENNALRALEAARRIHQGLQADGVASAIGVATGRAFCGDVGNATRRHYLVTGPLMHHGARLMQAADDAILVDDATAQAAAATGHFRFAAPERIVVKGVRQPLMAHRFHAQGRRETRLRGLESLHGRENEIREWSRVLDDLAQGRGGSVAIEAESGAGKSRLLRQMDTAAQARGFTVITALTSPFEALEAYAASRHLVRRLLWLPGDPVDAEPALLRQRLVDALRGDPAAPKYALIEDILPLQFADKGLAGQITGQARLAGLEDLLAALVRRRVAEAPLLLMIDDLQWLDDPSALLMSTLARREPRLLWVAASRPLGAGAAPQARRLLESARLRFSLSPLSRDSIGAIVADLLRVPDIPPRLVEFIHLRCEGLPFHAEQLALALVERGVVLVRDGRCRITATDLEAGAVPENLRDLIVSRLDGLTPAQQVTAKVASVIGRAVSADVVRALYPFPSEAGQLESMLKDLVAAAILGPVSEADLDADPDVAVYAFHHAIIQEVTYDLLTLSQRRPLHRQLAEYIEHRHGDQLGPHFAELAEHWERAADFEAAIRYRQRAAGFAIERSANHDALVHVEHIQRLSAEAGIVLPTAQEADLARLQGDACHELSRFEEAHNWFKACAALSQIRVPVKRLRLVASVVAEAGLQLGHRLGLGRPSPSPAARERDRLAAHIFTRLAEHAYFHGDALGLLHGTLRSLNRAERAAAVAEIVEGLGGLAIGFGTAGFHRIARFYRERAVARAERNGSLHDQGFAHLLAAVYSFQAGQWSAMDHHCSTGAAIYDRLGDRFRHQSCCVIQAYADLLRGDYAKAEQTFRSFGEEAERVENVPVRAWMLAGLALVDMVLGRPPARALRWVSLARDEKMLHDAERLLCDGIEAAAHLQAGNSGQALRAATTALQNMLQSAPTMGIALLSVAAVADVHLTLAERASVADGSASALMNPARTACRTAARYARKIGICRPRQRLLQGRLAMASGRPRTAARHWRKGLAEAIDYSLPLDQALCRMALAEVAVSSQEKQDQLRLGGEMIRKLGANPWLLWPAKTAAAAPAREREAPPRASFETESEPSSFP
jgi:adenylate cyclase